MEVTMQAPEIVSDDSFPSAKKVKITSCNNEESKINLSSSSSESNLQVNKPLTSNDIPNKSKEHTGDTDLENHKDDIEADSCQQHHHHDHKIRELLLNEANYDILSNTKTTKRNNYLSWDDYFMAISYLSAKRSKDPKTQNGACIVDKENRIVGIGYNGFPRGCSDDCLPWADADDVDEKTTSILHTKNPFVCHAEINAILNKCSADLKGARMYVPCFPSNECAKTIIQSGIDEIIYLKNDEENDSISASKIMFQMAKVKMTKYTPSKPNPVEPLVFSPLVSSPDNKSKNDEATTTPIATEASTQPNAEQLKWRDLLKKEANYDPTNKSIHQTKRNDYLSWDDYFMTVAFLSARRSKDPNTQVGACIVDSNKCIVGIGYNGFPRGCSDDHLPWARGGDSDLHKKYIYVVHAEVNAILNKGSKDVKGATLYVALFPCNECAKVIINAGIAEVVYLHDTYHDTESCRASRIMFEMAGVKQRQYTPTVQQVDIDFD